MDPSVLLRAYKAPQWPDPIEEYKGFLSLRQMMDLGKLRQVQLQQEQLQNQQIQRKAQWDQEDRQRAEAVRNLFAQNPDIGFQDIAKFDPALAFKLSTDRRLMEAAKSTAEEAKLKLKRGQGQSLADMMYANSLLPEKDRQADWDTAWGGIPVDLPPTQAEVQAQIAQGYGSKEQQAMANAAAEAAGKAATRPFELRKATADALTAEAKPTQEALQISKLQDERAGKLLGFVSDQPSLTAWYNSLPAEQRARIGPPPTFNDANMQRFNRMYMTAEQRQQAEERAATSAETARHHRATEAAGGSDPRLIEAVIANPSLWDSLTPTVKSAIAPDLARAGFTGFGTKLSDSAINKLSDAKSAIATLQDLRETLKTNEQYIGPIAGLQAMNPWSDARKARADIDRVKQRVGKALEGGVLRKEDEEKYKRILATLEDTPSTAIYKVDRLLQDMNRDMETYIEEQRRAGRRVDSLTTPSSKQPVPSPIISGPGAASPNKKDSLGIR